MAWMVEFESAALKELERLDPQDTRRILQFLLDRVASRDDPREVGAALKGSRFAGLWKYRVGNLRVICEIQDERVTVLVVRIGHRREIYR
jgi:mRNA interferase RelE/StbE